MDENLGMLEQEILGEFICELSRRGITRRFNILGHRTGHYPGRLTWNSNKKQWQRSEQTLSFKLHKAHTESGERLELSAHVTTKIYPCLICLKDVRGWTKLTPEDLGLAHVRKPGEVAENLLCGWVEDSATPEECTMYDDDYYYLKIIGFYNRGEKPITTTVDKYFTIQRLLSRIFDISDQNVQRDISNHILMQLARHDADCWELKILEGKDIVEAYQNEVGGHSCMTGSKASLTEFYAANPDRVKLAVARNPDGETMRTLVWKDPLDGQLFYDRVYPTKDTNTRLMRAILRKEFPEIRPLRSTTNPVNILIPMVLSEECPIPYMDSLKALFWRPGYTDPGDTVYLARYTDPNKLQKYLEHFKISFDDLDERCAEFIDGGPFFIGSLYDYSCADCGEGLFEDDVIWTGMDADHGVCDHCLDDYREVLPQSRRGYRYYVHSSDAVYSERLGEYIDVHDIPEYLVYLEDEDDYCYEEDAVYCVLNNRWIPAEDSVDVHDGSGDIVGRGRESDAIYCEEAGWYFVDEEEMNLWLGINTEEESNEEEPDVVSTH